MGGGFLGHLFDDGGGRGLLRMGWRGGMGN